MSHGDVADRLANQAWDRATIYRNLTDLAEAGLVRRTDVGDHVWRFEAVSGAHEPGAHPHFVCTECGTVECLPEIELAIRPRDATRACKAAARGSSSARSRSTCAASATPASSYINGVTRKTRLVPGFAEPVVALHDPQRDVGLRRDLRVVRRVPVGEEPARDCRTDRRDLLSSRSRSRHRRPSTRTRSPR